MVLPGKDTSITCSSSCGGGGGSSRVVTSSRSIKAVTISNLLGKPESQSTFLDVQVVNNNGALQTDTFKKKTDRKTLLRFDSYHPEHVKSSIPQRQDTRVRRIVQDEELCWMRCTEMLQSHMQDREYPVSVRESRM
ncbi:hypothetical protein XELAEV_18018175mg [Xenopus laevis]|uniref:Uncharacterized protein n=1 Tax=Xenopus laevis TaxID=8355 RepID=A0A974HTJ4_XENLA|nr:hypothetical protein XELAEV_18018175mg [Xenopus laevis]